MTSAAMDIRDLRSSRWLMPVLIGSLALNLIVVGAAASLIWRSHYVAVEPSLARRVVPNVIGYAAAALPAGRRQELEQLTKEERQTALPLRRALQDAREDASKALVAEPFDLQQFLAAQARVAEADQRSREVSFKLQTAIAVHLTPEERHGFLRWRQQQLGAMKNPLDVPELPANEQP